MANLSVIIPVFNVEKHIERCVRSLFEQTMTNIEYIFVDDGSPDNSIHIVEQLIKEYDLLLSQDNKQVIVKRLPQNQGLPNARKVGVSLSTGEYIAHCDSDDWIEKDTYAQVYSKAKKENLDMVFFDFNRHNGKVFIANTYDKPICDNKDLLISQFLCNRIPGYIWCSITRSSLFKENITWPLFNMLEDEVLMIQILNKATSIGFIDSVLYHYVIAQDSITETNGQAEKIIARTLDGMKNAEIIIDYLASHGLTCKYNKELDTFRVNKAFNIGKYVDRRDIYRIYRDFLHNINFRFILNPTANKHQKIQFMLCYTRVKPFIHKTITKTKSLFHQ